MATNDRPSWLTPQDKLIDVLQAIIIDDAVILTMVFYCMKAVVLSSRNMT